MRWEDLSKRAFREILATLILNVAQLSICISTYICVVCITSLFASTKNSSFHIKLPSLDVSDAEET